MKKTLGLLLLIASAVNAAPPKLQLANVYHDEIDLQAYWVSEKYDGVRAYWDGRQLLSRQGNIIRAPAWFTDVLSETPMDGELWIARGQFERLSGIVRRHSPDPDDWREIKYMVFDLPGNKQIFDHRLQAIKQLIVEINSPHIQAVAQRKIASRARLMRELDEVVSQQGEGLMLRRGASLYAGKRNEDLLKLKKYADAEAVVIEHLPGKGKFTGMLGSLLVETADRRRFRIGTGFSHLDRQNPPPIGALITYQYFGLTNTGLPRFASYLRVRMQH